MIINKKLNLLIFLSAISFLGFGQPNGSGQITYLENDAKEVVDELSTITIYKPNGEVIDKVIKDVTIITPGSTIEVPSDTVIKIYVKDGEKEIEISGYMELEFGSSSYRPVKGIFGKFWARIKKAFGSVTAYSVNKKEHLRTVKTEFEVTVNGDDSNFKLIEGKVAINNRTKVQLEDKDLKKLGVLSGDSLLSNNRILYVTERIEFLTPKDSMPKMNYQSLDKFLVTEKEIGKFFTQQFGVQRSKLKNSGKHSRAGFKMFEKGIDSSGIQNYEKAINQGEITRDEFIEAALLLTEAYFRNEELKQRTSWLDAAIYFNEIEDSISKRKVTYFKGKNKEDTSNVFLADQILTNEYFAWAYTVKILINGCLETQQENPRNFISKAENLKKQLNKK